MKLLRENRHVEDAGALAAEGFWNEPPQETCADGLLVKGPHRREACQRGRKTTRRWRDLGQHVAGKGARVGLQTLLFCCQREIDRHGFVSPCYLAAASDGAARLRRAGDEPHARQAFADRQLHPVLLRRSPISARAARRA